MRAASIAASTNNEWIETEKQTYDPNAVYGDKK